MKPFQTSMLLIACTALSGGALAASGSLGGARPQVMPVIVHTDAQGKVTEINPALQLSPKYRQLLIEQLGAWISKPASWKGHPVASTFIVQVGIRAVPRNDGGYTVSYIYAGSQPIAYSGPWHWNVIDDGRQFALVSDLGRWYPSHDHTMQLVRPNKYVDVDRAREIARGGGTPATASHVPPTSVVRTTTTTAAPTRIH